MSEVEAYGLGVDPPPGWETRIYRRTELGAQSLDADAQPPGPPAPMGAVTLPVVQVATIPLPADTADYGSDLVDELGVNDALIVVKEFTPASATTPLFAVEGMPRELDAEAFSPSMLQRSLDGQGGHQTFFNESGRAFCLYVVLGSHNGRHQLVPRVNQVLAGIAIEPGEVGP